MRRRDYAIWVILSFGGVACEAAGTVGLLEPSAGGFDDPGGSPEPDEDVPAPTIRAELLGVAPVIRRQQLMLDVRLAFSGPDRGYCPPNDTVSDQCPGGGLAVEEVRLERVTIAGDEQRWASGIPFDVRALGDIETRPRAHLLLIDEGLDTAMSDPAGHRYTTVREILRSVRSIDYVGLGSVNGREYRLIAPPQRDRAALEAALDEHERTSSVGPRTTSNPLAVVPELARQAATFGVDQVSLVLLVPIPGVVNETTMLSDLDSALRSMESLRGEGVLAGVLMVSGSWLSLQSPNAELLAGLFDLAVFSGGRALPLDRPLPVWGEEIARELTPCFRLGFPVAGPVPGLEALTSVEVELSVEGVVGVEDLRLRKTSLARWH